MRIPDQRSVCCDAPIRLNLLGYDFLTDSLPVLCVRCEDVLAGAALSDVDPDVRVAMVSARWRMDTYVMSIMWRIGAAVSKLPFIRITDV